MPEKPTTFEEIREIDGSALTKRSCVMCGEEYADHKRGRVQILLTEMEYVRKEVDSKSADNRSDGRQKKWTTPTKSVAATTRTMCEPCSVELYLVLLESMPPSAYRRGDQE